MTRSGILELMLLILLLYQNADLSSAPGDARAPMEAHLHQRKSMVFLLDVFCVIVWILVFANLATDIPYPAVWDFGTKVRLYAALPLAVGAVSNVIGGALSDWLVRRTGSFRWGRRLVGLAGYLMAAEASRQLRIMQKPFSAIVCLMLAEFWHGSRCAGCLGGLFRGRGEFRRHHHGLHEHGVEHLRIHFSLGGGLDIYQIRIVCSHADKCRSSLFDRQPPMVQGRCNASNYSAATGQCRSCHAPRRRH